MDSAMNNGICRCCASEGTFKDVRTTYHWMGEEEVYSDMLRDCLDITLYSTEDDADNGGICEVCITQLRNAFNFKKQVQHTEEQFKKKIQGALFKSVKIEPDRNEEENDSDNDNLLSEDFSGPEFEVPIKTESTEESKPKKRAAATRASTSRAKKPKAEDGEPSTKQYRGGIRLGCHMCEYTSKTTFNLKRHLRLKHDLEPVTTLKKLCESCGKVFFNDHWLAKHVAIGCPMSKSRICVKCEIIFDTKSEMYTHMRRLHWSEYKLVKLNCPLCDKCMKCHEEHDRHLSSEHGVNLDYQELTFDSMEDLNQWKGDIESKENVCFLKRKSSTGDTYYHCYPIQHLGAARTQNRSIVCPARMELIRQGGLILLSYQSTHVCERTSEGKKDRAVFCPVCNVRLNNFEELYSHLTVHDIEADIKNLSFTSFDDFLTWKSMLEKDTVQFYKRSSTVSIKNGYKIKKSYFLCTKSSKSSKKLPKTCPARITMTWDEQNGSFDVSYQSTHVGHSLSTRFNKLTKEERLMLADRIKRGDNLIDILQEFRRTADLKSKLKHLKKSDLYNVIRDFNIGKNDVNYGNLRFHGKKSANTDADVESNAEEINSGEVRDEAMCSQVMDQTDIEKSPNVDIDVESNEDEIKSDDVRDEVMCSQVTKKKEIEQFPNVDIDVESNEDVTKFYDDVRDEAMCSQFMNQKEIEEIPLPEEHNLKKAKIYIFELNKKRHA